MRFISLYAAVALAFVSVAVSLPSPDAHEKRQFSPPTLSLPSIALPTLPIPTVSIPALPSVLPATPTVSAAWGTYTASDYDPVQDIYTFKNIRFGAPPLGSLRFQKPIPPRANDDSQALPLSNGATISCQQVAPKLIPGNTTIPNLSPWSAILAGLNTANAVQGGTEDCLYLDVYVPATAFVPGARLPVAHWLFGGAFVFGSKDSAPAVNFYSGNPLIDTSGQRMIYIASNYRLGAFGWLAGTTMESEGAPNAGLWDQRLAFQWSKENVAFFGGDPNQITAMGESAGASSVEHHLILQGGTLDPMFSNIAIQSPAYQALYDRRGAAEDTYKQFLDFAGCKNQTIQCIQNASEEILIEANVNIVQTAVQGTFGWGPTADGNLVRQVAPLEYLTGNYYKGIESLLISHVSNEAEIFTPPQIQTNASLADYLNMILPTTPQAIPLVLKEYPSSDYPTEFYRLRDIIRDSTFTCNARVMTQTNLGKTYNMRYNVPADAALHASDLLPLYWSQSLTNDPIESTFSAIIPWLEAFARPYQQYFTNFIMTGNPNTPADITDALQTQWPHSDITANGALVDYLQADTWGFDVQSTADPDLPFDKCQFWGWIAAAVTIWMGEAPPNAVPYSPYVSAADLANASIYYQGGNH